MPSGSTLTLSSNSNHIGRSPNQDHYNVLIYDPINDCYILLDDLNVTFNAENDSDISELCYIVSFTKDVSCKVKKFLEIGLKVSAFSMSFSLLHFPTIQHLPSSIIKARSVMKSVYVLLC